MSFCFKCIKAIKLILTYSNYWFNTLISKIMFNFIWQSLTADSNENILYFRYDSWIFKFVVKISRIVKILLILLSLCHGFVGLKVYWNKCFFSRSFILSKNKEHPCADQSPSQSHIPWSNLEALMVNFKMIWIRSLPEKYHSNTTFYTQL